MNPSWPRYEIGLPARGLFEIPDIARVQVICSRGSLWITLDNDPRDIVLEAGESFFSTERRRALVFAFEPSTLMLRPEEDRLTARPTPRISFVAGNAAA